MEVGFKAPPPSKKVSFRQKSQNGDNSIGR